MIKRIGALAVTAALLASPGAGASASEGPAAADNYIFAGGGTPASNGVFFPGTAIYDTQSDEFQGVPYQIQRGSDVNFVNLDESTVSNTHKICSLKTKRRTGRPLFCSKELGSPGDSTLMITSHLKPGVYPYLCTVHFAMYGLLEVV